MGIEWITLSKTASSRNLPVQNRGIYRQRMVGDFRILRTMDERLH
jgi:hypothetical protein